LTGLPLSRVRLQLRTPEPFGRRDRGKRMKPAQLAKLRIFSLSFLLPGLAGLIVSALVSAHYLDTLPKWPAPEEMRMMPRDIHGVIVYQTAEEDRILNLMEYSSIGVFLIGLVSGFVYLEKWNSARVREADKNEELARKATGA